ncbi:MAG TPA: 3-dehydroquinate synthase, partial [Anaerolineales bacterium]
MPHMFLYGPPGTGKSTIGRVLAHSLDLPFMDLDRAIEKKAGMEIAQMMEQQGEATFRDLETAALKDIVVTGASDKVIALGGGALLRDENRIVAETHGTVIVLMAELPTLLERLKEDAGKRPLLAGNLRERLTSLLEKRSEHYSSFSIQMHVDGHPTSESAWLIQTKLGRFHLKAMGNYDVVVADGVIEQLGSMLSLRGLINPIVVTDENVARLHVGRIMSSLRRADFTPALITIPAGEAHKNLETIQRLWHGFLEHGLDRKSTVIALGGGVIGDLAGFAASTYMRGISWVAIPTTLLAMVDASLGGKTGFDLPQGKNLIGSFYPPRLVLADPQMLTTLPQAEFISGMAEVVKHGIIAEPTLFDLCARGLDCVKDEIESVVKHAMAVKIKIIEDDPYEKDFRAALNLGHTVGHAVELVSKFQLRHGEAVAIGIVAEAKLAERLNLANKGLSDRIAGVLAALGLPVHIPANLPRDEILRTIRVEKKKN